MVCGHSGMTKTELTVPLNVLKIKKPWISKLKAAGAAHVRRAMYDLESERAMRVFMHLSHSRRRGL